MDNLVTQPRPDIDDRFDTPRITAAVDALAATHAGREDVFRSAMAQLLKAEMIEARAVAQAVLLKDRHGRRCAERLCFVQDEIIRILYSAATRHLYRSPVPSGAERMAVVATGGYGRGLMAPESDIDLLFILPYKQTAWGEQVAEAILYCLWDMGLKVGHATRSVDESIRQARGDMTIRTAILETRFLTGDQPLYDELVARFDKEVVQGTAAEFVTAKLAEREERHRRAGQSRYLVEPNVKDGKGGLRDLHTLFWIAKYVYRVRETDELLERGVFDAQEYRTFRRCADFLWSVRCNIHFFSGRAEERLSFDMQREIAIRLGYTSHPGMQDVERFMKHYFLVAKDVGDLTAILCAKLEDQQAKPAPVLSRMMARLAAVQQPAPGARQRRFHHRQQPHQSRRARRVQAGSGQPDPDFPAGAEEQSRLSPGRDAHGDAVAEADQHAAARKSRSQPAVHGDPDVERRGDRAAAHERDRRARSFHPRLRQDRVDDAVQHVSPLHGRRASAALRRLPAGHRARRQRRVHRRQRPDAQDPARAPRGDLYHHAAARHRQGPAGGPFDRRRQGGAAAVPAARLHLPPIPN